MWIPGATRDPGVNAGYRAGRSSMRRVTGHCTVGSDSRSVGRRGYFNALVHQSADREGGCTQYAELDAVTWHAFEPYRLYGPGIEFERNTIGNDLNDEGLRIFEDLTPNQIEWGGRIADFCAEHGIPADLYGGPRFDDGDWNGWVNHKDVDPTRRDGLTRAEWDLITASSSHGGGASETEGRLMWNVYYQNIDGTVTFIHGIGTVVAWKVLGQPVAPYGLPMNELNYIGYNPGSAPTELVNPEIGFKLERASNSLTA